MNTNQIFQNELIAKKWIAAFNDQNIDNLLELYAEDAVHYSPKLKQRQPATGGKISGKAALRAWWEDAFLRLPTLQYKLTNLIISDQQLMMEYERTVMSEPAMMVAEILEISNFLIVRSRVYHG